MTHSPVLTLERDDAAAEGRAKAATSYYVVPGVVLNAATTAGINLDTDYYSPWIARSPIVIDQLACEVTTIDGNNIRMGFYRADRDWQPYGPPLADSGNFTGGTTGVKTYTPSTPIFVRPGRYQSIICSAGTPAFRIVRGGYWLDSGLGSTPYLQRIGVGRTFGPLPTPPSAFDGTGETLSSTGGFGHFVVYRVSVP